MGSGAVQGLLELGLQEVTAQEGGAGKGAVEGA